MRRSTGFRTLDDLRGGSGAAGEGSGGTVEVGVTEGAGGAVGEAVGAGVATHLPLTLMYFGAVLLAVPVSGTEGEATHLPLILV